MKTMFRLKPFCMAMTVAVAGTAVAEETPDSWYQNGHSAVSAAKHLTAERYPAKNVILFVGDGMGISTVTAARILEGQLRGENGEENLLSFEEMPYVALSKTYNTNQQTPDSAGTMTAMMTGVKTKAGVISINQNTLRGDCATSRGNELTTYLEEAEMAGKSTGVVTTARITHATPAATYAHSPERNWEDDHDVPAAEAALGCKDIARQLIEFPYGDGLEVALGGGRRSFLGRSQADPEDVGATGERDDERDLTAEWVANYENSAFVWNKSGFDAINTSNTDHLLGLFERSHLEYEYDRPTDAGQEPSLSEMTEKSLQILSRNDNGYFLMVEAGRIDHGHHAGNAYRALTDAIEFSNAVRTAMENTDPRETLIIVTADHSHVFTIAGYPTRGNDILGKVVTNGADGLPEDDFATDGLGLPYTTLGYQNGPGFINEAGRPDLSAVNTADAEYLQEAAVPMGSETHAGEDVAIFADGPGAYLFHGVQEQNYIYHVMKAASPLKQGPGKSMGYQYGWYQGHRNW